MPILKTLAFGRMYRYSCDTPGCEERSTVPADHAPPPLWKVDGEVATCPVCQEKER